MKTIPYNLSSWKRYFFTIWGGQALSLFGSTLVSFALVWHMTTTTGSAVVLTTATLVSFLPSILITPILGTLVDRWPRRWMMVLADGLTAVFTLLLAMLFWMKVVQIWHIYVLLFIRSLTSDLHFLSMQSATSLMVPEKHLTRVAGFNRTLQGIMNVGGPPLGALILAVLPVASVLMIDVATALFAILPLLFIAIPEPAKPERLAGQAEKLTIFQDFREGFRYVRSWKGLMAVVLVSLLTNFIAMPILSLMPLLVKDHFNGGAVEFGWVESALGVGTIAGGLVLGAWGGFQKRIVSMLAGGIVAALAVLAVAFTPGSLFLLAVSGFFILGCAVPFLDGPLFAILQSRVIPDMQGRVIAFLMSAGKLMLPFGLLIAGQVSERTGARTWFFVAGAGWLLINIVAFNLKVIVNIEEESQNGGIFTGAQNTAGQEIS